MKKLILATSAILLATQAMASSEIIDSASQEEPARKTWVMVIETSRGLTQLGEHMYKPACRKALSQLEGKLYSADGICLNFATGEVIGKRDL